MLREVVHSGKSIALALSKVKSQQERPSLTVKRINAISPKKDHFGKAGEVPS